jgi:hypothetical protein
MSRRDVNTATNPRGGLIPVNGCEVRVSDELQAPADVTAVCGRLVIKDDVARTLAMAREHFSVLGDPRFEIVEDPESQECYLAIHVNATGGSEEVFEQSESFLDVFVANIAPGSAHHISLVSHSTAA